MFGPDTDPKCRKAAEVPTGSRIPTLCAASWQRQRARVLFLAERGPLPFYFFESPLYPQTALPSRR